MKTSDITKFVITVFLLVTFCTIWSPERTMAQSESTTQQKGLKLSPLRSELDIAPGTSLDGLLTVTNLNNESITVHLSAEEFSVINQQYDYAFTSESNISKWVLFNTQEINLAKGESKKVNFSIGVPLSAEPGGRYISLFASTETRGLESAVSSRQRIASLLYVTVTGDVTRAGNLLSLTSPWLTGDNVEWSATVQNTGTTHFRSRYQARIENLFGGEAASMYGDALILPGTVRLVSDSLPSLGLPGVYKVIYNIGLGDTPAQIETRYFLYIAPLAAIMTALMTMVLIAVILRQRLGKR